MYTTLYYVGVSTRKTRKQQQQQNKKNNLHSEIFVVIYIFHFAGQPEWTDCGQRCKVNAKCGGGEYM